MSPALPCPGHGWHRAGQPSLVVKVPLSWAWGGRCIVGQGKSQPPAGIARAMELRSVGLKAKCHPWGTRLLPSPSDGVQGMFWHGARMGSGGILKLPALGRAGEPNSRVQGRDPYLGRTTWG